MRAGGGTIQQAIRRCKTVAAFQTKDLGRVRQRTAESPGKEKRGILRIPMW
jgi:hypothetical protein